MRVLTLKNNLKMKKIRKFTINPEKVIKNEDLVNLRGGVQDAWFKCSCPNGFNPPYGGANPFCIKADSAQDLLDVIEQRCKDGVGSCSAGCGI